MLKAILMEAKRGLGNRLASHTQLRTALQRVFGSPGRFGKHGISWEDRTWNEIYVVWSLPLDPKYGHVYAVEISSVDPKTLDTWVTFQSMGVEEAELVEFVKMVKSGDRGPSGFDREDNEPSIAPEVARLWAKSRPLTQKSSAKFLRKKTKRSERF